MLETRVKEWSRLLRAEGRQSGEAQMLLRQLSRRFGDVPESIRDRITAASSEELEEWSLRILDATRIEDVIPPA